MVSFLVGNLSGFKTHRDSSCTCVVVDATHNQLTDSATLKSPAIGISVPIDRPRSTLDDNNTQTAPWQTTNIYSSIPPLQLTIDTKVIVLRRR